MATKRGGLADELEQRITQRELLPGDTLPSEAELRESTGYSRTTVRAALAQLEQRGLIEGGPGTRRRVTDRVLLEIHVTRPASRVAGGQSPTPGADSWAHDIAQLGHHADATPSVRTHPAGALATRMGISQSTPVITRELLRSVDSRPHNLATWTFPAWLARATKLAAPDDIAEGSIPYLAGIGHAPRSFTVEIEARMPTRAEAGTLAVPPGVPLLIETRTGTADSGVVFVSVTRWPGDRARLVLDL